MFADFDGVMVNATVVLNGVTVAAHQGGYLPCSAELTGHLAPGDNVLAVVVDARWLDVPPDNPPGGTASVDYLQPGGIYRDVTLRVVPDVFIADVFAKPVNVLSRGPRSCRSRSRWTPARVPGGAGHGHRAAAGRVPLRSPPPPGRRSPATGTTVATLTMTGLGGRDAVVTGHARSCTPCGRPSPRPGQPRRRTVRRRHHRVP